MRFVQPGCTIELLLTGQTGEMHPRLHVEHIYIATATTSRAMYRDETELAEECIRRLKSVHKRGINTPMPQLQQNPDTRRGKDGSQGA